MKKLISTIIILIALIIFIPPYFIGSYAKNQIQSEISLMEKTNPDATIALTQFKRGWFSSKVNISITSTNQKINKKPIVINGQFKIHQGPVLIDSQHMRLGLFSADGTLTLQNTISIAKNLPVVHSVIYQGFNQSTAINTRADVDTTVHTHSGTHFQINALLNTAITMTDNTVAGNSTVKNVKVTVKDKSGTHILISPKTWHANFHASENNKHWTIKKTFQIPSVIVRSATKLLGSANNISISSGSISGSSNSAQTSFKIGTVKAGHFTLSNIEFSAQFSHYPNDLLKKLDRKSVV